jgi:hypothetical protein
MNTGKPFCEVVFIIGRNRLIDAESYERTYGWDGRRALPNGYYVACWPAGTAQPHFLHGGLRFAGPYGSRHAAEAALAAKLHDQEGGGLEA